MKQKYSKSIMLSAFTIASLLPVNALAQGANDGLGGDDGNIESLYTKVTNIEEKQKALNFYVNFAESFQAEHSSKTDEWNCRPAGRILTAHKPRESTADSSDSVRN